MTPTPLINRSEVREYAVAILKQNRPALAEKFTRAGSDAVMISDDFFVQIEARLRASIVLAVDKAPTTGKILTVP